MIFGSSVLGSVASAQLILRVDASQTSNPTPDGSSWVDAYPTLTEALDEAWVRLGTAGTTDDVTEIWVAQGTYKPTTSTTDRTATLRLAPKAFLYGGFAGGPSGETVRSARGGLFDSLQTRFVNCLIADNTAAAGGGVVVFGGTSANQKVAVFDHCTVPSNVATGLGDNPPVGRHTGGGGFHVNRLARLDLRGSVVWANTGPTGRGTSR